MIVVLWFLFRIFLTRGLVTGAYRQAERGLVGSMEGHAEMDMAVTEGPILKRATSPEGFTAISHYFVMDWASIWKDIVGGLLITGLWGRGCRAGSGRPSSFQTTRFWRRSGGRS